MEDYVRALYPDASLVNPSCAARCTYYIEKRFGLDPYPLADLQEIYGAGPGHDQVSLYAISKHLEKGDGLYTHGMKLPLWRFDTYFDSAIAIVHANPGRSADGTQGHYLILEKRGDNYTLLDPPEKLPVPSPVEDPKVLHQIAEDHGLTGVVLVVSDEPIPINFPYAARSALALTVIAGVICCTLLWRAVRKRRRKYSS